MIERKIAKKFINKKIIITGGTGLIGRQLTKILCDLKANVSVISLDNYSTDKRAKHIIGDLSNFFTKF